MQGTPTDAAQGPQSDMAEFEMGNLTQEVKVKFTPEAHADLAMISSCRGDSMQDFIRECTLKGIADKKHEYTLASRHIEGERILRESRGKLR